MEEAFPGARGVPARGFVRLNGRMVEMGYEIIEGLAVLGGDVVLGTAEEVAELDRQYRATLSPDGRADSSSPHPLSATRESFGWAYARVPYEIDTASFSSTEVSARVGMIQDAIAEWNTRTLIKLVKRNGEADYIRFTKSTGCSTEGIGKKGGRQLIRVNTCKVGNIKHEIGHAVGLFHEHIRHDRDVFIDVHWGNILNDSEIEYQYELYPSGKGIDRGKIDFGSIMMYSSFVKAHADDPDLPVMSRKDGSTWTGQRDALSPGDIQGVTQLIYSLDARTFYQLENYAHSGLCMRRAADGRHVIMSDCATNSGAKSWIMLNHPRAFLESHSDDVLILSPGGTCLTQPDTSVSDGRVTLEDCHGGLSQRFAGNMWSVQPIPPSGPVVYSPLPLIVNNATITCVSAPWSSPSGGYVFRGVCIGIGTGGFVSWKKR
jgi:hypothetical protein